jgi:hypothetical protein
MGDFAPSVEAARLNSSVPIETKPHPPGGKGVKMSLDEVALRVAKGRNDPRVRSWAIRAVHAAGVGGMHRELEQAEAVRTALKKATSYVQDPLNTEFMQAASETLCLDDKGFCFRGGDCFPKGTFLLKRFGDRGNYVPIEHVEIGDEIWGLNNWTKVDAVAYKGRLALSKIGYRWLGEEKFGPLGFLLLTADHHIYVENNGGLDRIRVSEARFGQSLAKPNVTIQETDTRVREFATCRITGVQADFAEAPCYDIQTEDHYVYLPEHDVTVSNCDDLTVAYASATLSIGIPTNIVGQAFNSSGVPSHVIAAIQDSKSKEWYRVDPSTDKHVGDYVNAKQEWWIDPLDVNDKTSSTVAGAGDFVGVGKLGHGCQACGATVGYDRTFMRCSVCGEPYHRGSQGLHFRTKQPPSEEWIARFKSNGARQGYTGVGRGGGGGGHGGGGGGRGGGGRAGWGNGARYGGPGWASWAPGWWGWADDQAWGAACVDLATAQSAQQALKTHLGTAPWLRGIAVGSQPCDGGRQSYFVVVMVQSAGDIAKVPTAFDGVPISVRVVGALQALQGLGQGSPATPDVAASAVAQVQSVLYDLQTACASAQAGLDQLGSITTVLGFDPEPTGYTITGLSNFPSNGTWTASMDTIAKGLLSQGLFLLSVCQQAYDGVRDIYVDATTNGLFFAGQSSDPYYWREVLATATDSIIGIYSPAGVLLYGITQALGAYLTPSQVQTQQASAGSTAGAAAGSNAGSATGTQGIGALPVVEVIAIAGVTVVASIATCIIYVKLLQSVISFINMAVLNKIVATAARLYPNDPDKQAAFITKSQQQQIDLANAGNKDPFGSIAQSAADIVKWLAIGGAVIGGGILLAPVIREAGESAAAAIRSRRLGVRKKVPA